MRFRFAFASLALSAAAVAACSSADFKVAADSGGDTGDDGATDPCAPDPSVAKFCVTVKSAASHPPYDASSGAPALGLDGHGTLQLLLFAEDPIKNPSAKPATPPIKVPNDSLDIDHDLPVVIEDAAPEGTYWFVAVFQDDTTTARDPSVNQGQLAGDFITVPTVSPDLSAQYPQATLTKGATATKQVDLRPLRGVTADLKPTANLFSVHGSNPSVHGDGPVLFVIYDGILDGKSPPPTFYGYGYANCVNLFAPIVDPKRSYPIAVPFVTPIDGKHSVAALLYDYGPPPTGVFPGTGVIISPIHDGPIDKIPTVDPGNAWTTVVEIPMQQVLNPVTGGTADTYVCK